MTGPNIYLARFRHTMGVFRPLEIRQFFELQWAAIDVESTMIGFHFVRHVLIVLQSIHIQMIIFLLTKIHSNKMEIYFYRIVDEWIALIITGALIVDRFVHFSLIRNASIVIIGIFLFKCLRFSDIFIGKFEWIAESVQLRYFFLFLFDRRRQGKPFISLESIEHEFAQNFSKQKRMGIQSNKCIQSWKDHERERTIKCQSRVKWYTWELFAADKWTASKLDENTHEQLAVSLVNCMRVRVRKHNAHTSNGTRLDTQYKILRVRYCIAQYNHSQYGWFSKPNSRRGTHNTMQADVHTNGYGCVVAAAAATTTTGSA